MLRNKSDLEASETKRGKRRLKKGKGRKKKEKKLETTGQG